MQDRVDNLIVNFPLLIPTIEKLNANNVMWMIAGSGCLYVHGNERMPQDIDFYLPSQQHEVANRLFDIESYAYTSSLENVKNSNPFGDHSMQLTSNLKITKNGSAYDLEPTTLVMHNRTVAETRGEKFYFAPVEEALLVKVLLGRGPDMGKQDIADVKNFLKIHPNVSTTYITARQIELGLEPNFWKNALI